MFRGLFSVVGATFVAASLAAAAHAASLNWTFDNVNLSDGGKLTGGFTYDAATSTISNINWLFSAGSVFDTNSVVNASPLTPVGPDSFTFRVGDILSQLVLPTGLTDAGGTVALITGSTGSVTLQGICFDIACSSFSATRTATSGTVFAGNILPTVPLPAGMALMLTGLAGIGGLRTIRARRK